MPNKLKDFEKRLPSSGGLFTKRKRLRLLGKLRGRRPEGEPSIQSTDFWFDVRQSVKAGLYDLEMLIETAPEKELTKVITAEALKPSVQSLLWNTALGLPPDPNRARIAQMLIEQGFGYLGLAVRNKITLSHGRTIQEAIDLANFLAESAKPESERRYSQPNLKALMQR
ncbi:MAG: hypothetical protein HYY67_00655 [Thaumarchaeota archaeon]|nr:hypothetical protein [Nitrososphaerota archaeon]